MKFFKNDFFINSYGNLNEKFKKFFTMEFTRKYFFS